MKRKVLNLMTALIVSLIFVLPAYAADRALVEDYAGLMSEQEQLELEQQARSIFEQHGVGVYIATVDDYKEYTDGDIYDAADYFYQGREQNGLLLLLSLEERDYVILAYGDDAQYAFNDAGLDSMEDYFLDDFGSDSWYSGFTDYLFWSDDYLVQAELGTPYSTDHLPMSTAETVTVFVILGAIVFLFPLIVAGIYIVILSARMRSVAEAVEARAYVSGNLNLTRNIDLFSHTTTTRTRIEKESGSSSGSSSGGGRGRSGKF